MFIETRNRVQKEAYDYIKEKLNEYNVETKGIYIQDVVLPKDLVEVRTSREIANQEIETYKKQTEAEVQRVEMEKAKGTANMQEELARRLVSTLARTRQTRVRHRPTVRQPTSPRLAPPRLPKSKRCSQARAQAGRCPRTPETALLNALTVASENHLGIMPHILVLGGGNGGSPSLEGLAATLTDLVAKKTRK